MLEFLGSVLWFIFAPIIETVQRGEVCTGRFCQTSPWAFLVIFGQLVALLICGMFFSFTWRQLFPEDDSPPLQVPIALEGMVISGGFFLAYLLLPNLFYGYNGH